MKDKIKQLMENIKKDHISESASQCAYYVILSFIPFIILILTLIQYTSISSKDLIEIVSKIIPENMKELVVGIIREVYSKSLTTISWSLIFTLISADKALFALSIELHQIYEFTDNKKRNWIYLKLSSIIKTTIFIIIIVVSLIVTVFGKTIINSIKKEIEPINNYSMISEAITRSIYLILFFILFLLVYRFMSNHKTKFKIMYKGAIFSSLAVNIISFIFARYLDIFKGFSTTYGSLTTLMLIMMWTYSCFYSIFLGAEINKLFSKNER